MLNIKPLVYLSSFCSAWSLIYFIYKILLIGPNCPPFIDYSNNIILWYSFRKFDVSLIIQKIYRNSNLAYKLGFGRESASINNSLSRLGFHFFSFLLALGIFNQRDSTYNLKINWPESTVLLWILFVECSSKSFSYYEHVYVKLFLLQVKGCPWMAKPQKQVIKIIRMVILWVSTLLDKIFGKKNYKKGLFLNGETTKTFFLTRWQQRGYTTLFSHYHYIVRYIYHISQISIFSASKTNVRAAFFPNLYKRINLTFQSFNNYIKYFNIPIESNNLIKNIKLRNSLRLHKFHI